MKTVSRFEANLLSILRFFLRRAPAEPALPLLADACPAPPCLSRAAVELVQDTLAKGCTSLLAAGGWRRERFLRADRIAEGRLWERTPPGELGLPFSRHSLQFLIWVTANQLPVKKKRLALPPRDLTVGDHLLLYFAWDAVRPFPVGDALAALAAFAHDPLCRLAHPEDFARHAPPAEAEFSPWMSGVGSAVLEALQPELAERWEQAERDKAQLRDWPRLVAVGRAQEQVLTGFLRAVESARRYDLARFLLRTADRLLERLVGEGARLLGTDLRLVERAEVYRAVAVVLRQLDRLRGWERQARSVGYFDEGYAAARLWKADWEDAGGERLFAAARGAIRQGDAL